MAPLQRPPHDSSLSFWWTPPAAHLAPAAATAAAPAAEGALAGGGSGSTVLASPWRGRFAEGDSPDEASLQVVACTACSHRRP